MQAKSTKVQPYLGREHRPYTSADYAFLEHFHFFPKEVVYVENTESNVHSLYFQLITPTSASPFTKTSMNEIMDAFISKSNQGLVTNLHPKCHHICLVLFSYAMHKISTVSPTRSQCVTYQGIK